MSDKEVLNLITDDLKRFEDKIDDIQKDCNTMSITLAKQEIHLETNTKNISEHIRRTTLSEKRIHQLENTHTKVKGVIQAIGITSTIVGLLFSLYKIIPLIFTV